MFTPQDIQTVFATKGYTLFQNDSKPHNLNIVGIRNLNGKVNQFDDWVVVLWKYKGVWNLVTFEATTDPGKVALTSPSNPKGTAILKEGQYKGSHMLGMHKGKYKALVQAKALTVFRDANRNAQLDFTGGKEDTGVFGINIHRARPVGTSIQVDNWSEGCQVIANSSDFNQFITLCEAAAAIYGNSFTYTLINTTDFKHS